MSLCNSKNMLSQAFDSGWAVGAFNALNLEYVQGIVAAAEELKAPVIVQVSQNALEHAGLQEMAAIIRSVGEKASVPVVVHLDHATDLDLVKGALNAGFTSVMFDGSRLPFEENVRLTKEVALMAHDRGATAEGELGKVPSALQKTWTAQELAEFMTDPNEALEFARATGVDALAVAVGSVHKMQVQEADVDAERVRAIKETAKIPLVLHGSSGVTDNSLVAAVRAGIAKVNIATALSVVFCKALGEELSSNPGASDARPYLQAGRNAIKELVKQKIMLLGCAGKA